MKTEPAPLALPKTLQPFTDRIKSYSNETDSYDG